MILLAPGLVLISWWLWSRQVFIGKSDRYCSHQDHEKRLNKVVASLRARPIGSRLSLHRRTAHSNTIRNAPHKNRTDYHAVDLGSFDHIIEINVAERYVVCEPGVTIGDLLRETLNYGMTPVVVPEFPNITVGGAISGGALESSSRQHGQFFDSVLEIECLTPELCTATSEKNADLFYAVSASYNSVALLTKVTITLEPTPAYVDLSIERVESFELAVRALDCDQTADTVEGIAFSASSIAIVTGSYSNHPSHPVHRFSRHWDRWYFKTIRDPDRLSVPYWDYCFRYKHGAFWMADFVLELLGGDHFVTRALLGGLLDTKHLFGVLHASELSDLGRMRIIQDCYVPADNAAPFLDSVDLQLGVYPLWLCPVKATATPQKLACHYAPSPGRFINVGIYGRPRDFPFDAEVLNRQLVDLLVNHRARSMLYAQVWHDKAQFEAMYDEGLRTGEEVRRKYGGTGAFFDLYDKVALSEQERAELRQPVTGSEQQEQLKVVMDILRSKVASRLAQ